MLGESSVLASSGSEFVPARATDEGTGPNLAREEGEGSVFFRRTSTSAKIRWPSEETLALIKIRSEMDVVFRESAAKGPLWEELSRKMAKLGYLRSGKKCREKFENVYKYHKHTKDCRTSVHAHQPSGKSKTYRFFDQLEAIDANNPATSSLVSLQTQQPSNDFSPIAPPSKNPSYLLRDVSAGSTSSAAYSDQDLQQQQDARDNEREDKSKRKERRKRKKRGWMELFEKLMGEVVRKQEDLQKNLFDAIERREREQVVREEAWRAQEVARINRECEMLACERSTAAAKDNAVISFLQRITESSPLKKSRKDGGRMEDNVAGNDRNPLLSQQTVLQFSGSVAPAADVATTPVGVGVNLESESADNGEKSSGSSSRWPKVEIEALIKLRTNSDIKYIENAPKGPLWEEISAAMKKLGYNRNPKRCKEKWENINKYFKKVKESNKKRPDDSKTCPYFELLDELYKQKVVMNDRGNFFLLFRSDGNNDISLSAATPPLMVTPEQQWPPPAPPPPPPPLATPEQQSVRDTDDDDGQNSEVVFGGDNSGQKQVKPPHSRRNPSS